MKQKTGEDIKSKAGLPSRPKAGASPVRGQTVRTRGLAAATLPTQPCRLGAGSQLTAALPLGQDPSCLGPGPPGRSWGSAAPSTGPLREMPWAGDRAVRQMGVLLELWGRG